MLCQAICPRNVSKTNEIGESDGALCPVAGAE